MIQQTPQADAFKEQLRDSLQRETLNARAVKIARHVNVYDCGDQDDTVYFIESGQIKLVMLSSEGKECLLAIHGVGDVFGELWPVRLKRAPGNSDRDETKRFQTDTLLSISGV